MYKRQTMQSDIVLSNKKAEKTLIVDAKFYTHNMQMKAPYMTQTPVSYTHLRFMMPI